MEGHPKEGVSLGVPMSLGVLHHGKLATSPSLGIQDLVKEKKSSENT